MIERSTFALVHHAASHARAVVLLGITAARRLRSNPDVLAVHLRRHWKYGPHLRVTVCAANRERVRDSMTAEAQRLTIELARLPAANEPPLDPHAYAELSARLGRSELVPGPYLPLWPDRTVVWLPAVDDDDLIVDPRAQWVRDQVLDRFRTVLELALDRAGRDPARRLRDPLTLLILLAASYPDGGLGHGYLSYTSHLEDFLHDHDPDGRLRRRFADHARTSQAQVRQLIQALVPDPTQPCWYRGEDELARAFTEVLQDAWRLSAALAAEGGILPLLHPGYGVRAAEFGSDVLRKYRAADDRTYSEFHAALRQHTFTDEEGGRIFAAYRFLVNLLYSQLPLLDVAPAERFLLAYAITDAVQALTGRTWRDIFAMPDPAGVPAGPGESSGPQREVSP